MIGTYKLTVEKKRGNTMKRILAAVLAGILLISASVSFSAGASEIKFINRFVDFMANDSMPAEDNGTSQTAGTSPSPTVNTMITATADTAADITTPTADISALPSVGTATPDTAESSSATPQVTAEATYYIPAVTESASPMPTPVIVEASASISFVKKKATIRKGQKVTLQVKVKGIGKVNFTVDKKKIIKIVGKSAKKVTVKGNKKGKAVVSAVFGGKSSTCKVTVKKKKKKKV